MHATRRRVPVVAVVMFALVAVWLPGAGTIPLKAQQGPSLTPTPLEAFAALPDARTAWSTYIGRLDGGTAYADVSAVALESPTSAPGTRRGVSIELRHEGLRPRCGDRYDEWLILCDRERAIVYIDEADLASLREAYLTDRRAEVHEGHAQDLSSWWKSTGASGLILFGYVLQDRSVEEFVGLLASAEDALRTAPR